MSVYKRGKVWWYSFWFAGKYVQESAKTKSKTLAVEAEKKRRRELEEGYNSLRDTRKEQVQILRQAAEAYRERYKKRHPKSYKSFAKYCIRHLIEHLGDRMLIDIDEETITQYQDGRLEEGAAGKTINDEVGFVFRIMGDRGVLVREKMKRDKTLRLSINEDAGEALSSARESRLLTECKKSKSPFVYLGVMFGLNTGMRDSEIRRLRWKQIDLFKQILTVGESKSAAGTGRTVPLNPALLNALLEYKGWYESKVAPAKSDYYIFPWSRCWNYDPTRFLTTFKTAWRSARDRANVQVRFHDLRHTAVTKLAEAGAGEETIKAIAGAVSQRWISRYAHIRTEAKRRAVEAIATEAVLPTEEEEQPTESVH